MSENYDSILDRAIRGEDIRDLTRGMPLATVAAIMKKASDSLDGAAEVKASWQRVYDLLRMTVIPGIMDEQQLKSCNVDGVGRVTLTSDAFVSVAAGQQDELKRWLIDNGFEDLIREQVNSSTLKAWAIRRVKEGEPVPECVRMTPYSRASITKV